MYKFKLEPVLKFKKQLEEMAQIEFYKKIKELEEKLSVLSKLKAEKEYFIEKMELLETQEINFQDYLIYKNYINLLSNRIEECQKIIKKFLEEIEKKRAELIAYYKERKILQRLDEQQRIVYEREMKILENKFCDEINTICYNHESIKKII
ncbi:MAG TPA: flagellar export protein FliJ [Candidatus Desulfofervidus auxilii]|uniref:Flagellar FliJ protein n=1 Tax=Desulfofervidus auxilii TaxID=1621989 RepID=A0A7C2A7Y1_DESA2|nr:flagellar export protein FliJ [Candidatus Desulfofervidus auxilii]